jgi:chain length determinant protein EpsF
MTLDQFLTILRARWVSALAVLLTVVGVTALVSLLLPNQYTATSSVFVDIRSPDPVMGGGLGSMKVEAYMASQVDVIQSERVALHAIRSLRLNEDAKRRALWQRATKGHGDFEAWLAEQLHNHLEVKPSPQGNVITVAYTSADARLAALLANAFVQGYIDTTRDLRVQPARQYNAFFEERAKQLREALEQAQAKLSTFQRNNGIVGADERADVETSRLNELSTQLVLLQTLAAETAGRQAQAQVNAGNLQEVMNNPVVASLTADLSRQEARLSELSLRAGDQHPEVKALKASIAQLRSKIEAESGRVSTSLAVNNSVNQSRVANLRGALEEQRAKVLRLATSRDEVSILRRDVENAQRAYDAVLARVNQTDLASQDMQTNVSVLKQATEPAHPSFPNILLNTVIAALAGMVLAVGTALLRELLDHRLRTIEDITGELGQPVLVHLPAMRLDAKGADSPRRKVLSMRVLTGLPRPSGL